MKGKILAAQYFKGETEKLQFFSYKQESQCKDENPLVN